MKLRQIYNGKALDKKRFKRPQLHTQSQYDQTRGIDSGSTTSGNTLMPVGVPLKPRHRQFLGMEPD